MTRAALADTCLSAAQLGSIVANIPIRARGSEQEITESIGVAAGCHRGIWRGKKSAVAIGPFATRLESVLERWL